MPPTLDSIKLLLIPSEGNVSHMYVDTVGKVTVGIGNMLPNAAAACALAFVNRTTGNRATPAEITADFNAVAAQPPARSARLYRPFTKLDLPNVAIDNLFRDRVAGFQDELRRAYPDYDDYPDSVQLALLDMAFNMGTAALRKWPRLNKAISEQDWEAAAADSTRPKANPARNAAIKALFEKAAEEEEEESE